MVNKERIKVFAPAAVVAVIGFLIAYQFVRPAPPDTIVMSTGRKDGAYYLFAEKYRDILARNRVTLQIRMSAGSVENIKHLESGEADLGFVQGGAARPSSSDNLVSLGSMYYEPLWVFYRGNKRLNRLTDLAGKTIAVGAKGSGTRAVTVQLLKDNAVTESPTVLSPLDGGEAASALVRGDVDAAFFIASSQSPIVQQLLTTNGIDLMSFERAAAYGRIHHYLSRVILLQGVIDLERNIPRENMTLVAATANLVVRKDFHPALIDLILQAATAVHGAGDLLGNRGEFPSPIYLEFPLSEDAERFYRRGPSFLRRYLPFWGATFVDRMMVMLIPFIALLVPLIKVLPPTYRWRMQSRIYRWYKNVKAVDVRLRNEHAPEQLKELMAELDRIEDEANKISIPAAYADRLYTLRVHINFLRQKLVKAMENDAAT
jgi:uncharacterized protein